jgi:transposase
MAERDIITMSQKEMKRLHVIHKVGEGLLTEKQAAEIISLSERQIRRIVKRIRDEGDKGIRHRSRGKESNRRLPKKLVERVTRLYQERYQGFGPTLKDKWGQVFTLDISSFPINLLIVE